MMQTVLDPAAPLPSRGDVLALTLGDLAERVGPRRWWWRGTSA